MSELKKVNINISGRVQGVGYRFFAEDLALRLSITGYVRNLPNRDVFIEAEANQEVLESFIKNLWIGPPMAKVIDVKVVWKEYEGDFTDFSVRY